MSEVSRGVGGRPTGKDIMLASSRSRVSAVLAVALLLMSSIALAVPFIGSDSTFAAESSGSYHHTITYHSNNGSEDYYTIEYSGISSSEYNPEYWAGSFTDTGGNSVVNWTGPGSDTVTSRFPYSLYFYDLGSGNYYSITLNLKSGVSFNSDVMGGVYNTDRTYNSNVNASLSASKLTISNDSNSSQDGFVLLYLDLDLNGSEVKKVFSGWNTSEDGKGIQYYPGDVIPSYVTDLYATWTNPALFTVTSASVTGSTTLDVELSDVFSPYKDVTSTTDLMTPPQINDGMYSTIYRVKQNLTLSNNTELRSATYRSYDVNSPVTMTFTRYNRLAGGAVFDNINLNDGFESVNHGDSDYSGLFANGNVLILGLGIGTTATSLNYAPQIVGGSYASNITSAAVEGKTIVSSVSDDLLGGTVNLGTYVIIHSGVYQNVVAGSITTNNYSIGSTSNPLSTYLVMKGGTVLDTIVGGSGNFGTVVSVSDASSVTDERCGGTFVYLLGCNAPGDDYEEVAAGYRTYDYYVNNPVMSLSESTIVEGAGSSGTVSGSSHVFISGDATIWDVQGGGRRSSTSTSYAYVEISGDAVIKHLACGTVTDGNESSDKACVGGVHIVVKDNPTIASLFGSGYDTWSTSKYSSFIGRSGGNTSDSGIGVIDVDISGGTIGYVYGGGYRGSIGTSSRPVDVNIDISGGTVLEDVFGGGRGGLEKALHNSVVDSADQYGAISRCGNTQTTGQSFTYGDIVLTIRGSATIGGSVYGGGESVPIISSYTDFSPSSSYESGVAKVIGDISITVESSATVSGSVYGSGKGIELDGNTPVVRDLNGDVITDPTKLMTYAVIDSGGNLILMNWAKDGVGTYSSDSSIVESYYRGYAKATGTVTLNVAGGSIGGSVYGGGAMSVTEGPTSATVSGGSVSGSVYGGGLGTSGRDSNIGDTAAVIGGSATVGGNVYGAAAFGLVSGGSSSVTIGSGPSDTCSVTGSVYGGGEGVAGVISVSGNNTVSMSSGSVSGSVYGGSMMGVTVGDTSVSMTGGSVSGSVYGGGKGAAGYDSVRGSASVVMNGSSVTGNVYGGSELGIMTGDIRVTVISGTIAGHVYGGGLGTAGNVSVRGKRNILISGGTIEGSVYGGSAYGSDCPDGMELTSNCLIIITSGTVNGSVYGGGFKGETYGSADIYIGYSSSLSAVSGSYIVIGGSVYGGGDVGELAPGDLPFSKVMVRGNASVYIHGSGNDVRFDGSIFGSGNSCLTGGSTLVNVEGLTLSGSMESIQRADRVSLWNCTLSLSGRSPGTVSTVYSFYGITELLLFDGTAIHLYSPMNEIGYYSSLNADSETTVASSPQNRVVLHDGTVFDIKNTTYGEVRYGIISGYTLLSIDTTEDYYGAFAFGSLDSVGGFVVESEGSYKQADTITFENCRCWFISGVVQRTASVTLKYDPSAGDYLTDSLYVDLPVVSATTKIRYTGGYFTSSVSSMYSLVSNDTPGVNQYSVFIGSDDGSHSASLITFGDGQYVPNELTTYSIMGSDRTGGTPQLYIIVTGSNSNLNAYVGYATISFQEVVEVTYSLPDGTSMTDYLIYNVGEIKLDMYSEGEDASLPDMDVTINTVEGAGEVSAHLPQRLTDTSIYLKSFQTESDTPITLSSQKNRDNTNGWSSPLTSMVLSSSMAGREYIGTLNGGYIASLGFSVSGFDGQSETFVFVFTAVSSGGDENDFTVTLKVQKEDDVRVTFVDSKLNVTKEYYFPYGSKIKEANCPSTGDNFVGWYTDDKFINQYNFNNPLTSNITLYARYMYMVTFDNMNGTTSVAYVQIVAGGATVSRPTDPVWEGYNFAGWYQDRGYGLVWNFDTDVVLGNMTLYARWTGDVFPLNYIFNGMPVPDGTVIALNKGDTFTFTTSATSDAMLYTVRGSGESAVTASFRLKPGTSYTFSGVSDTGEGITIDTLDGSVTVYAGDMIVPGDDDSVTLGSSDRFTISTWDKNTILERDGSSYVFNGRAVHVIYVGAQAPSGYFAAGDVIRFDGCDIIAENVAYGGVFGSSVNDATYRVRALLEASNSTFKFVRWQIQTAGSTVTGIYSDTVVNILPEKTSAGEYGPLVLTAQLAEDAINVVLDPNCSDVDVNIEAPKEFLVFKSDDGNYRFYLNNATRIGYRIVGWAWESDATASSASFRSIGTEWVLTGDESIYSYNEYGEKVLTLYAIWERIEYTVTIVEPDGGSIVAGYGNSTGSQFTVHYGELISLSYIASEGYTFSKWYINGEGDITDASASSTTLIVRGSCAVYAQLKGLEEVTVNLYIDGGLTVPSEDIHIMLEGGSLQSPLTMVWSKNVVEDGKTYAVYKTSCRVGTFDIILTGADSRQYSAGTITVIPDGVVADVYMFKLSGSEHLTIPEYALPGSVVDYTLDENYELKPLTSGTHAGESVILMTWYEGSILCEAVYGSGMLTLPSVSDSAVTLVSVIGLVDRTVTISVPEGFSIVPDTTEYTVQHGSVLTVPVIRDSEGYDVVPTPTTGSDYILIGWFTDPGYSAPFESGTTPVVGDITLYPQISEKAKITYTVLIYQMGTDGTYGTPLNVVATDNEGEPITYAVPSYTGLVLNEGSSTPIAGTIATSDLVVKLYYDRMYGTGLSVSYGSGAPSDGYDPSVWSASGSVLTYTGNLYYGQSITLVSAVRTGYTWTGWNIDGVSVTESTYVIGLDESGTSVHIPSISAEYTVNTYTLTMVTAHGSFEGGSNSKTVDVAYGTVISTVLPNISAEEGYSFVGWKEGDVSVPTTSTMPARNMTLTAVWTIVEYTFEFGGDANVTFTVKENGESIVSGASVEHGSLIVVTMSFRDSYTLSGYTMLSGGTPAAVYGLDGKETVPVQGTTRQTYTWTFVMKKDLVLSVVSEESQYQITYHLNGKVVGTEWVAPEGNSQWNVLTTVNAVQGQTVELTQVPVVATGYRFSGWYSDQAMSSSISVVENISSDVHIYGRIAANTYTIIFDPNGGSGEMAAVVAEYGKDINIVNGFTRENAVHIGWYCAASSTVHDGYVKNLTSEDGATVTLTAVWIVAENAVFDGADHKIGVGTYEGATWYFSENEFSESNAGSVTPITQRDAGQVHVHAMLIDGDGNRILGSSDVIVTPKTLTDSMVGINGSYVYNGTSQSISYSVSDSGLIVSSDYTVTGDTSAKDAGSYSITVSGKGNYTGTVVIGWEMGRAEVTLSLSDTTFRYSPETERSVSVIIGGLYGTDAVSAETGGTLSATVPGTYTVTVTSLSGADSGNYRLPAVTDLRWVITPGNMSVTEYQYEDVYDGNPHHSYVTALIVSSDPDVEMAIFPTVYYGTKVLNSDNYNIDGSTAFIDRVDVCSTTVYYYVQADHCDPVSGSLTLEIRSKDITGADIVLGPSPVYNGTEQTQTVSSVEIDGLTVTYSVTGNAKTEAGEYVMYITGNGNFSGMVSKDWSLLKKDITVTPGPDQSKVYGDSDPVFGYGLSESVSVSGALSREAGENVGSYAYLIGTLSAGTNYNLNLSEGLFTISQKELLLSPVDESRVFNGETVTLTAYNTSGLLTGHTLSGVQYSVSGKDVGTYSGEFTGTPSVKDGSGTDVTGNYRVSYGPGSLKITHKGVTVTPVGINAVYGDTIPGLTATVNGLIGSDEVVYSLSRQEGTDVGTYTITASGDAVQGNYSVAFGTAELKITQRPVTISADKLEKKYGEDDPTLTATVDNRIDDGYVFVYSVVRTSGDIVGDYTITASGDTDQGNYSVSYVNNTFRISKADYVMTGIEFNGEEFTYDGEGHPLVISGSLPTGKDGSMLNVSYSVGSMTDVGSAEVVATFSTDSQNYNTPEPLRAMLVIKPASLTIVTNGASKVYDGKPLTATGALSGLVNGESVEFVVTGTITSVGTVQNTYEIRWNGTAKESNYVVTNESLGSLEITKRPLTITGVSGSLVYNRDEQTIAGITSNGLVEGHTVTGVAHSASGTNAGVYDGTFTGAVRVLLEEEDISSNYSIGYVVGKLTILTKDITSDMITVHASPVYDGESHTVSFEVRHGDVLLISGTEYVSEPSSATDAGTHRFTVGGTGNYSGSVTMDWYIEPKAVTVKANDSSKTYGTADPELTANVTGLLNGDSVLYDISRVSGENVGEYVIGPTGDAVQGNYKLTFDSGVFTIVAKDISELSVTIPEHTYNAGLQSSGQIVKYGEVTLGLGTDYTVVSGDSGTAAGDYHLVLNGKGNYTGTKDVVWTIAKKVVGFSVPNKQFPFNGSEYELAVGITGAEGADTLTAVLGGDYKGTEAKGYTAIVTGLEGTASANYALPSEVRIDWEITVADMTITVHGYSGVYDGNAHTVYVEATPVSGTATVYYSENELTADNYTSGSTQPLEVTDAFNGVLYYYAVANSTTPKSGTIPVSIERLSIETAVIDVSAGFIYDGTAHTVTIVSVKVGGLSVTYDVSEGDTAIDAGTYTLKITGNGNFTGTATKEWSVGKADYDMSGISFESGSFTYDGQVHNLGITGTLPTGKDGTSPVPSYSDGLTDVGSRTVTVTFTTGSTNYNAPAPMSAELTVVRKTVEIVTDTATKTYDGTELRGTGSISGIVTGEGVTFTVTGSIKDAGSVTNTYTIAWDGNAKESNYEIRETLGILTVNRAVYDMSYVTYSDLTVDYDGNMHNIAVTGDLPVGSDGVCVTVSYSANEKNAGTYTMTASFTGSDNYEPIPSKTAELKINAISLKISTGSDSKVYDGTPLKSAEKRIEGLVSGDSCDVTVTGSQTDVGSSVNTCSVNWNNGTLASNYLIVYDLGTLEVTKKDVVFTGETGSVGYDGNIHTLTGITQSGLVEGHTFDGLTYRAEGTNAGVYEGSFDTGSLVIRSGSEDVTSNYAVSYEKGNLTINKKPLSSGMLELSGTYTYNGGSQTVTYSVKDGSILASTDYVVTGDTAKYAGGYTLVVTATDAGNYSGTISRDWTISKMFLYIAGEDKSFVYNGETQSTNLYTMDAPAGSDVLADGVLTYLASGKDAGEYIGSFTGEPKIINGSEDVTSNYDFDLNPGKLVIERKDIAGSNVDLPSLTYNGLIQSMNPSSVKIGDLTVTFNVSGNEAAGAGSYNMTIDGTGNFKGSISVQWEIAPATLTVTADDKTISFRDPAPAYTVSYSGFVNGEDKSVLGGSLTFSCPYDGSEYHPAFDIVPSGLTSGNYEIEYVKGTLTVEKKRIGIPSSVSGLIYDGTERTGVPELEGYSASGNSATDAGVYTATLTLSDGYIWNNGSDANVQVSWSIGRATVTVSTNSAEKVYGGTPLTAGGSITGIVNGETYTFTVTGSRTDSGTSDNTYSIVWDGTAKESNYIVSDTVGTLTVNRKQVTVTTESSSREYNGTPLTAGGSITGIVNGETYTFTVTGSRTDSGTSDNTYSIVWDGTAKESNYTVNDTVGTLTVSPRDVTVTANSISKTYGSADPFFTASVLNTVGSDNVVYVLTRSPGESVGTYTITVSGDADQGNYRVTFNTGVLTITKAALRITADDKNVVFTAPAPEYTVSYSGFVNDEDKSVLGGSLTFSCPYDGSVYAEHFDITPSGYTSDNYDIEFVKGTLSVGKKSIQVPNARDGLVYNGAVQEGVPGGEGYGITANTAKDAGSYDASLVLSSGYLWSDGSSASKTVSWSIDKLSLSPSLECSVFRYDGTAKTVTVVLGTGLPDAISPILSGVRTATDAGTYTVVIDGLSGTGAENYSVAVSLQSLTWKIESAATIVNVTPYVGTYDGEGHMVTVSVNVVTGEYEVYFGDVPLTEDNYSTKGSLGYKVTDATDGAMTVYYYVKPSDESCTPVGGSSTLEILHKQVTVTSNPASKVFGDPDPELTATVTGTIGSDTLVYTVTRVAGEDVGTYGITSSGNSDQGNYSVTFVNNAVFTVTKKNLTSAMLSVSGTYTYDGTVQSVSYGINTGAPISASDYEISGDKGTDAGEYRITMTAKDDGNYSGTISCLWTVGKARATVVGDDLTVTYDGSNHQVATFSTTGLASGHGLTGISYLAQRSTNGSTIGSFTGSAVIKDGSDTDVTANYDVVMTPGTLTVLKKALSDSMLSLSGTYTYNGAEQTVSYTVSDGSIMRAGDYTITGISGRIAGTYTVTVTATDSGNYSGTISRDWTIDKRSLTITGNSSSVTYNGAEQSVSGFVPEGLADGDTIDGITFIAKGTDAIAHIGSFSGTLVIRSGADVVTDCYDPVTYVNGKINIERKDIAGATVVLGTSPVYDGSTQTQTVVSVTVGGLAAEYTVSSNTGRDAGAYTLTILGKGNFTGTVTESWSIGKAIVTVVTESSSKVYDGTPLTAGGTISGLIGTETCTFTVIGSQTDMGSTENGYTIVWNGTAKESNYTVDRTVGTLTVTARDIGTAEVTLGTSYTYDGNVKTQTVASVRVSTGPDTYIPVTFTVTGNTGTDAGDYTLTVTGTGNFTGTATKQWSIERRALDDAMLSVSGTYTYDGTVKNLIYEVRSGTPISVSDYSISGDTAVDAGTYTVTMAASEHGNYSGTVSKEWSVGRAAVTVSTDGAEKVYDGTPLTAGGSITGIVDGETYTFTVTGSRTDSGTSDNTYSIVWDGTAKGSNYEITEHLGTLTVSKRALVLIGGSDTSVVYDGTVHSVTDITYDGLVPGHVCTGVAYSVSGKDAGRYVGGFTGDAVIKSGGDVVSSNYDVSYRPGELVIAKKALSDSMLSVSGTYLYDGTVQHVDYLVGDGTAMATSDYSVSGDSAVSAGVHTLIVTASDTGNYSGTISRDWTIGKRDVTFTGESGTATFDGREHVCSGITAVGLVDGHGYSGLTYNAHGADASVYVGTFSGSPVISDGNGVNVTSNYNVILEEGTLTIDRMDISGASVVFGAPLVYDGTEQTRTVSNVTLNGLNVTFDVSGNTGTHAGSYTLTVTGTGNFTGSADSVWDIRPATLYVVTDGASKTYDGTSLTADGRLTGLKGSDTVTFSVTGSRTDAGSSPNAYAISWDGAVESDYVISEDIGTLTVLRKDVSDAAVSLGPGPVYNGSEQTQTVTGVTVSGLDVTYSVTGDTAKDAGRYTLVITGTGNFTGSKEVVWNIDRKDVTVTTESGFKVYDGEPLVASGSVTGIVPGETYGFSTVGTISDSGVTPNTYILTWNGTAKESNYRISEDIGRLVILPRAVYLEQPSEHPVYTGSPIDAPVPDGPYTIVFGSSFTDAGIGYETVLRLIDSRNYVWADGVPVTSAGDAVLTWNIERRSIEDVGFEIDTGSETYTGSEIVKSGIGAPGLVEGRDYTVSYTDNIHAGVATIRIDGIGNYCDTLSGSFVIGKAPLAVDPYDAAMTVKDAIPEFDYLVTGLLGSDTLQSIGLTVRFVTDYASGSAAGTYKIYDDDILTARDYDVTAGEAVLTVYTDAVFVEWDQVTYRANGQVQEIRVSVTDSDGNAVPYHLDIRDADGNPTEFKDAGTYHVKVVLDDPSYVIFPGEVTEITVVMNAHSINWFVILCALCVCTMATYVVYGYVFGKQ